MKNVSAATIWNFIQFQLGWFALVLSAAAGRPLVGLIILAIFATMHVLWFSRHGEWLFILMVGVGGWLWESIVHSLGLLNYPNHMSELLFAPVWMAGLWVNFATTIQHSLAWLKGKYLIAAMLGGIGGPLAFLAGEKLDAVAFGSPVMTTFSLIIGWAILTPLVFFLAEKFDFINRQAADSVLEVR